jgi:peptidyl-prolyl cis-trans isomerase B (cyclophilin B)
MTSQERFDDAPLQNRCIKTKMTFWKFYGISQCPMKNHFINWLFAIAFCVTAVSGQAEEKKEDKSMSAKKDQEVAIIKTSEGEMVAEFWSDVAPKTVENFKKLSKEGFYDGTAFHRIIKGFMIQGGDPLSKKDDPMVGTGGPGYMIKAEFNDRPHQKGVLSMARSQDPDSAGSQFFICLGDASFLDHQYTAFGKLIKGEDVLEKIGNTPVASSRGEKSKPEKRIEVQSVKIVPASEVK